ncbi:hypothetical protein M758_11G075500 [Ceratodon purpureus]|uniref:Uncharacterized protein n=1 Tax=Ceratodon purpureus TaxID=3225 RepID=A0A8T0GDI1_CERPU|nr:hypothetical protein KC19_11G077800 [Ceratodon purpureus]KAG0600980.1 hypothetical protein M758_11G075500 [Ceratodon purpureus]
MVEVELVEAESMHEDLRQVAQIRWMRNSAIAFGYSSHLNNKTRRLLQDGCCLAGSFGVPSLCSRLHCVSNRGCAVREGVEHM